ncbi:MAG: ABC transporter ATP-binding protein/permease [Defluviitaleaceae bacterium]|nr:ABC transporter ATP-binding protein/permease [Defluviitaleaceae bacterium]
MKIFLLCKPYLLKHKFTLMMYMVISLASTAIAIISPRIIGDFLDDLIAGGDVGVVIRFCLIFGGLSLLGIVKNYAISMMQLRMRMSMGYSFNKNIMRHIYGTSLSYTNNKDSAYLSQRINNDAKNLIVFCISILQSTLTNLVALVVPFLILLSMHYFMAILLAGFLVVYIIIYIAFRKPLYNVGMEYKEAQDKLSAKLFERLKFIRLIKLNSIQGEINERTDESFSDMKKTAIKNQKINFFYSGMDGFVSIVAQISLFVVGGISVLAGNFTIGMFTIFISYFNMMLSSAKYFFGLGASYQLTLAAHDRVLAILEQKQETNGTLIIDNVRKIELRNVSFSYSSYQKNANKITVQLEASQTASLNTSFDANKKTLTNFSATFAKGKIYALVGANGVGKSSLVNLILGMYIDEYSGIISYNDIDIRHIDMVSVRKNNIGVAEQEPMLINDSIRFNLDFNVKTAKESHANDDKNDTSEISDSILKYISLLNMEEFISKNSLNFHINENNTNTSGGEKQKISILKMLHKNPDLMIFDEPTSALDAQTTMKFAKHLQQIKRDKIIIIITHDEVVMEYCDDVLRLT